MNPFKYGEVVSGENFCGRKELLKTLTGFFDSGQNVMIRGERRMGKTSLIHEAVQRYKKRRGLFIDIQGVRSVDELCRNILNAIIAMESQGGVIQRLLKNLAHLRPSFSVDPITGMPTLSFDSAIQFKAGSIQELLTLIQGLNKEKPLVVVIDEFQDILKLEEKTPTAIAQLRSQIQHHSEIPYVFSGSIRNKMDEIFIHPDSPFYKSAIPLAVGPLERKGFVSFLTKKFKQGNRKIQREVLDRVLELTEEVPGDVQQFCEALWSATNPGQTIELATLREALQLIFSREKAAYEVIWGQLSENQVKVLVALAQFGGQNTTSGDFLRAAGTTNASSVRYALKTLEKQKILYLYGKEYRFSSLFFRAWVLDRSTALISEGR